ncbi:uncharacterized protein LOC127737205 [Mytilus californianus]|uniref:uncharacterized protein LOC127737205 n=1 Tax=Mytilus californianus TaxID=6549 RepID=UPI0022481B3F|nr:uncharacterized protein LOC127737205 [Mytilus californianus]
MASLSVEEENYVRMSLLLTGISPRAARTFFDSEFAPACLDATIKKEYNKLLDLKKKHRINQSQWNLLCPRFPDVPDSKTFDLTLMILLLRNLTPMTPPLCGFDHLPSVMETTHAADLARIKHYRNYLAHLDDGKLDSGFFNTAWNDITNAIDRLGGQQMKQECDHLKTKPLDQTNQEIMMDIKHSNNEIRELKDSFESLIKSHELLQERHAEVKKSHEILQDDHRKVTQEMETIKTSQKDTVPWNIRERINDTLKDWKDNDDRMFINTRAAQYVLKCIKENSCVTITASSGVGKTATLRHVALQMAEEEFDVLLVTAPHDIINLYNPKKKTLFVIDDLCGNFSLDQSDIKCWEPVMEDIKKSLDKKQTKILAACRLQVYQDEKFNSLSVFKSCVCNILSENICLSKVEKEAIAKMYLNAKASEIGDFYDIYDCFPLLCKLYHDNPELIITDFFQNPFSIYEAEIDKFLKKGHYAKYCALALCVMFNNKLKEEMLTEELNEETRIIIENTCEACRLDRGTSRLVLQDELDSLTHTFTKKEQNMYKIIHDKIFDFLAKIYGQKIIYCLIKNADSSLIKDRFLLESNDEMDQFITIIPQKYHQMYIQRMIDDWSKGKVQDVFSNINMKISQFTQNFLCYLKTLDISYQRRLANICDEGNPRTRTFLPMKFVDDNTYDTCLLHCCYIGDTSLVKWCCDHGVNIHRCTYNGQSPVMKACEHGHTEIVKMLLDRGADCKKCDILGQSPVIKACEHGHIEIVKILLDKGVDYNKCDNNGKSSVMLACGHGHTEIVKMLFERGADCYKCDILGQSPVIKACEHGHTEIVKMLLDRGADCDKCDRRGQSPVMKACEHGHTELAIMLLDREVDCNKCDNLGQSLVIKACEHGHTEIVNMLLDREVDCNKCDILGQSPIMKACEHGHTEIVKMLLDRGADCNKCDILGQSPLLKASQPGHTEIVKMLLDKGAVYNKCDRLGVDYNICDWWDESALIKACLYGYTEKVKMLLDREADYNKCDMLGQSPVMNACEHGQTEKVKMLLDRKVDCNKCDMIGQSPLMKACEHGHSEIVKMLLDKGADYYCNQVCYYSREIDFIVKNNMLT